MLKYIAIWLVSALGVAVGIYLIGSFCAMSFDIMSWSNGGGRFAIAFVSVIGGFMGCCAVHDLERLEAMTQEEREKELHRRAIAERDSHADY